MIAVNSSDGDSTNDQKETSDKETSEKSSNSHQEMFNVEDLPEDYFADLIGLQVVVGGGQQIGEEEMETEKDGNECQENDTEEASNVENIAKVAVKKERIDDFELTLLRYDEIEVTSKCVGVEKEGSDMTIHVRKDLVRDSTASTSSQSIATTSQNEQTRTVVKSPNRKKSKNEKHYGNKRDHSTPSREPRSPENRQLTRTPEQQQCSRTPERQRYLPLDGRVSPPLRRRKLKPAMFPERSPRYNSLPLLRPKVVGRYNELASRESSPPRPGRSHSRHHASPRRRVSPPSYPFSPRRRLSRSPQSPRRRLRSPRMRSRSPRRWSRSPRRRSMSPSRRSKPLIRRSFSRSPRRSRSQRRTSLTRSHHRRNRSSEERYIARLASRLVRQHKNFSRSLTPKRRHLLNRSLTPERKRHPLRYRKIRRQSGSRPPSSRQAPWTAPMVWNRETMAASGPETNYNYTSFGEQVTPGNYNNPAAAAASNYYYFPGQMNFPPPVPPQAVVTYSGLETQTVTAPVVNFQVQQPVEQSQATIRPNVPQVESSDSNDREKEELSGVPTNISLSSFLEATMKPEVGKLINCDQVEETSNDDNVKVPYRPDTCVSRATAKTRVSLSTEHPSKLLQAAALTCTTRQVDIKSLDLLPTNPVFKPQQRAMTTLSIQKPLVKLTTSTGVNTDPMLEPEPPRCSDCEIRKLKRSINKWTQTSSSVCHNASVQGDNRDQFITNSTENWAQNRAREEWNEDYIPFNSSPQTSVSSRHRYYEDYPPQHWSYNSLSYTRVGPSHWEQPLYREDNSESTMRYRDTFTSDHWDRGGAPRNEYHAENYFRYDDREYF